MSSPDREVSFDIDETYEDETETVVDGQHESDTSCHNNYSIEHVVDTAGATKSLSDTRHVRFRDEQPTGTCPTKGQPNKHSDHLYHTHNISTQWSPSISNEDRRTVNMRANTADIQLRKSQFSRV